MLIIWHFVWIHKLRKILFLYSQLSPKFHEGTGRVLDVKHVPLSGTETIHCTLTERSDSVCAWQNNCTNARENTVLENHKAVRLELRGGQFALLKTFGKVSTLLQTHDRSSVGSEKRKQPNTSVGDSTQNVK